MCYHITMKIIKIFLVTMFFLDVFCGLIVPLHSRGIRPLLDLSAFTIVLDPGHGGKQTGAVGPSGLTEKQVNLEVALILRDLLEKRKCRVIMTRDDDQDVSMGARTALVKKHSADIFLSLHHNATLAKEWKNHTQTYYAMNHDRSSRLLGRDIHEAICDMFKFPESKLFSGNYYVLRRCGITSVLGEPCFIVDPIWEDYLRLRSVICNEAIAYYRGLVRYLNRGVVSHRADWLNRSVFFGRPSLTGEVYQKFPLYSIAGEKPNIFPLSPGKFSVSIDGVATQTLMSKKSYRLDPGLYIPGKQIIEIKGESDGGNVLDPILKRVLISPHPADIKMSPKVPISGDDGFSITSFTALDGQGRPLPDGLQVEFTSEGCTLLRQRVNLFNGSCSNVIIWKDSSLDSTVNASIGTFEKTFSASVLNGPDPVIRGCVRNSLHGKVVGVSGMENLSWIQVRNRMAKIRTCGGYFEITPSQMEKDSLVVDIELPGYHPRTWVLKQQGRINEIELQPRHDGILINRKIVIDPIPASKSSSGKVQTLLSRLNFGIALRLAQKLRLAGADVQLTRKLWNSPSLKERIAIYNSGGVKLGLAIDMTQMSLRGSESSQLNLYHYHSSSNGKWFCQSFKRVLPDYSKESFGFAPGGHPELKYTSPAVVVVSPVLKDFVKKSINLAEDQFLLDDLAENLFKSTIEYFQSR